MGASLGLRQGPKHAQASSAGVMLSLPGRDGNNAAAEPGRLRQGRKKFSKGPPTPTPNTPPPEKGGAEIMSIRKVYSRGKCIFI